MRGSTPCQTQSATTAAYSVCRRACLITVTTYATPTTPQAPRPNAALESACHGALSIADISSTAQKCTIVGVANARAVVTSRSAFKSAASTITTNCRPVSAADEEPTIT